MQHISGTVTADATIKKLEDGREFISFSIADYDSYKPKNSNERVDQTTYFNCTYWIATGVAKVLRKGAVVDLIGKTTAKAYQGRDDKWNAALNFNAGEIRFSRYAPKQEDEDQTGSGTQANSTGKSSKGKKAEDKKDDLPF